MLPQRPLWKTSTLPEKKKTASVLIASSDDAPESVLEKGERSEDNYRDMLIRVITQPEWLIDCHYPDQPRMRSFLNDATHATLNLLSKEGARCKFFFLVV